MVFDEFQLETIKAALRAYRAFSRGRSGRGLTWLEVTGDIEAYTGAAMGPDLLRQFVEGVSKKRDPARTRVPSEKNLEAIVSFLTDPDIDALSTDEVKGQDLDWQAPVRLIAFLRQDFDAAPPAPPSKLAGEYEARLSLPDTIKTLRLTLRVEEGEGVILVKESCDIYGSAGETTVLKARKSARGWSVLTPEDNLLFFLKSVPYGRNHYWVLAADADLWSNAPIRRMALMRHDYPAELEDRDAPEAAVRAGIVRHAGENVVFFERA